MSLKAKKAVVSSVDETPTPKKISHTQPRVFKGAQILDHDLFKLLPAPMLKNTSYNDDAPIYERLEHCHIFHTIDSSGKVQTECAPVGGHFHEISVVQLADDAAPSIRVSGPKKWVITRKGKKKTKIIIDIGEHDTHTHEVKYIRSEKIQMRKVNAELAKLDAETRAKQETAIDGISEG